MSKTYYNLYIDNVINLAETIVIKSDDTSYSINSLIQLKYGQDSVDPYDKSTWKYYQNICGQYHTTDRLIELTSIDTLQTITLTRENLTIHKATKIAYKYGSRNYIELVTKYPDLELLIIGIFYPADMDTAINAKDGAVLSFPADLVEENEYNLIKNIENWVKNYKIRWYNQQFNLSDSLYATTHLGLLYLNLVPAIINLRLQACKTNEAHSFHVRQYLTSHGLLDEHIDNLTSKQTLFFYRNINYIERNNGKKEIFHWLVEHIMTERNLPLAEFVMKHDVSDMPNSLYPEINFRKKIINTGINTLEKDKYLLNDIFHKEELLNNGNFEYIEQHKEAIEVKFQDSLSSVVITKILESSLIDYTDATVYPLHDILLNHWLSFSANGYYSTYINFKNPATGSVSAIHSRDAYIYFIYVFAKALGIDLITVPQFIALHVSRIPKPTVTDLMNVVDTNYVTIGDAQTALSYLPFITPVVSVSDFNYQCKEIYTANQQQLGFISNQEHQYKRGLIHNMVNQIYCDSLIRLEPEGTIFENWLTSKKLPITEFTQDQYLEIYKELYENATGGLLDSISTNANLQKSMINLLSKLSSYSIQILSEINTTNLKVLNWAVVRVGDQRIQTSSHIQLPDTIVEIIDVHNSINRIVTFDINNPIIKLVSGIPNEHKVSFEINVKPILTSTRNIFQSRQVIVGGIHLTATLLPTDDSLRETIIGYDGFKLLPTNSARTLKDIYDDCTYNQTELEVDINTVIIVNSINAFITYGVTNSSIPGFDYTSLNTASININNSIVGTVGTTVITGVNLNTGDIIL